MAESQVQEVSTSSQAFRSTLLLKKNLGFFSFLEADETISASDHLWYMLQLNAWGFFLYTLICMNSDLFIFLRLKNKRRTNYRYWRAM